MYFMHNIANTRGHAHSNGIEHPHGTKHVDEVKVADGAAIGRHRRIGANMNTVNFLQKPINGKMIEYTRMIIGTNKIGRIASNGTKHPHGPEHDHDEGDREDKRMATKAALAYARGRGGTRTGVWPVAVTGESVTSIGRAPPAAASVAATAGASS